MAERAYNVLFLCTHNSARSIMAEAIIDYVGRGKFKGYSAGSYPATAPNHFALETLRRFASAHRWAVQQELGGVRQAAARQSWIS